MWLLLEYYSLPECTLIYLTHHPSAFRLPPSGAAELLRTMNSPFPLLHTCIFYNLTQNSCQCFYHGTFEKFASGWLCDCSWHLLLYYGAFKGCRNVDSPMNPLRRLHNGYDTSLMFVFSTLFGSWVLEVQRFIPAHEGITHTAAQTVLSSEPASCLLFCVYCLLCFLRCVSMSSHFLVLVKHPAAAFFIYLFVCVLIYSGKSHWEPGSDLPVSSSTGAVRVRALLKGTTVEIMKEVWALLFHSPSPDVSCQSGGLNCESYRQGSQDSETNQCDFSCDLLKLQKSLTKQDTLEIWRLTSAQSISYHETKIGKWKTGLKTWTF